MSLEYGKAYFIRTSPDHICDGCSTVCGEMTLAGIYDGNIDGVDWFNVFLWSCLTCRSIHATYRVLNNINVSKEFEEIKK